MLDSTFCVVCIIALVMIMVDQHRQANAIFSQLTQQREDAEKVARQAAERHVKLATLVHERHVEIVAILRANIVPDRVSTIVETHSQRDDVSPETPREPAVSRSQRPPAPVLVLAAKPRVPEGESSKTEGRGKDDVQETRDTTTRGAPSQV